MTTPQERARDDIKRFIEDAIDMARDFGRDEALEGGNARLRALATQAIAEQAVSRILDMELLVTGGEARPVSETRRQDYTDSGQVWWVECPNEW